MRSLWHKHPAVTSGEDLTLGQRAADATRNGMGSWPFVFAFLIFMCAWAAANSWLYLGGHNGKHGFDPYPYILLNLLLSTMAGMQGAILLIAAKRADQISSELALHTERNTEDIKTLLDENTQLTRTVAANTDLLDEIHQHVTATAPQAGEFPPKAKRVRKAPKKA